MLISVSQSQAQFLNLKLVWNTDTEVFRDIFFTSIFFVRLRFCIIMKKVDISIGIRREVTRAVCETWRTCVKLNRNFTHPHAITYTHNMLTDINFFIIMQKRRRTKETEVKNDTISSLLKTSVSAFKTSLSLRDCVWLWETEISVISRTFTLHLLYKYKILNKLIKG